MGEIALICSEKKRSAVLESVLRSPGALAHLDAAILALRARKALGAVQGRGPSGGEGRFADAASSRRRRERGDGGL